MQNQPRRPQQQRQPQRQLSEEEARQEYWRRQREMYQDPNVRKAELKHRQQMEEAIEDPDGKRYGMGLITTAVVLSLILLVLCAALVALIVMSQPKPKVTTLADLGDSNGFATISDTLDPRGALEPDTNIMPTDIPVLFDKIIITRFADGTIEVEDFGRGIPMDYNAKEGRYNWELVYCELYAGGKYNNNSSGDYEFSLGLNGLGACATQYASEFFQVTVFRDHTKYEMGFKKGVPVTELMQEPYRFKRTGTIQRWKPDTEVFTEIGDNQAPVRHQQRNRIHP